MHEGLGCISERGKMCAMSSAQVTPVLDAKMRALRVHPYPGHPKGCPKFGKDPGCPPQVKRFDRLFDMSQPFWAIWTVFPIGEHMEKMRAAHPDWSERQTRCCLYWQKGARAKLGEEIRLFEIGHAGLMVTRCPEAMGINITETFRRIGIELEWPPVNAALQIALAGSPLQGARLQDEPVDFCRTQTQLEMFHA